MIGHDGGGADALRRVDVPLDLLRLRGVDRAVRELVRQWVAALPR